MMIMMMMDTHIARLLVILSWMSPVIVSFGDKGGENLLKFKDSLVNSSPLRNWNASTPPCMGNKSNWIGVICVRGKIWGLQLENMGLQGSVNIEILETLTTLRIISLMNNHLQVSKLQVKKLHSLKALYLSNNRFGGEIPDDAFQGMRSLKRLLLANNGFTGKIPSSLTVLPELLILRLEGNQFDGQIPAFNNNLRLVSFANNQLEGPIPASLSHMGANMFSGNKNLCGKPLQACISSAPAPVPSLSPYLPIVSLSLKDKASRDLNFALILISVVLLLVITATIVLFLSRRKQLLQRTMVGDSNKLSTYNEKDKNVLKMVKSFDAGELVFLKDDNELRFGLQDLLSAPAEVLGSGKLGASYKVVITDDEVVVAKRYKQMNNAGKESFCEHMTRLGKLNNQNLQPLMAYNYMKEEKLLVSKYMDNGSLATHLHGNHCGLNWQTRLKIIKGVARGLVYLYKELPDQILSHGNLKSSNVLLDESFNPLLCDYALAPMINQEEVHRFMAAYRSPEYALKGRISKKTDVWCLGILMLEVITGRFPENYVNPDYDSEASLATWVNGMVKEKKSSQVFDTELLRTTNNKIKMIHFLNIGLSCCVEDLNTRPDLNEVVEEIENLEDEDHTEITSTICEVNVAT